MEREQQHTESAVTGNTATIEDIKAGVKAFAGVKRAIKKVLKEGEKTIPEIAGETGMSPADVTYYLMTMLKFGDVAAGDMDDDDEYYFYRLKREK